MLENTAYIHNSIIFYSLQHFCAHLSGVKKIQEPHCVYK